MEQEGVDIFLLYILGIVVLNPSPRTGNAGWYFVGFPICLGKCRDSAANWKTAVIF
jgi:hypothetical protein